MSRTSPTTARREDIRTTAFTLVELLVVLVILSVLASLSFAGLNVGRQRAKRDKTISTIRKLDEITSGMYADRLTGNRLAANTARLLTYEMPDQWVDIPIPSEISGLPQQARSAVVSRYSRITVNSSTRAALGQKLGPAECLWLSIARSGYEPDALEQFRPDELTDLDGDGAKEFCDGWGRPIYFLRWAPGFTPYSAVQTSSEMSAARDANDLLAVMNAMRPLIYSAGPDGANADVLTSEEAYGLQRPSSARSTFDPCTEFPSAGEPVNGSTAYRDNVTNHDIMAR